MKHIQTYESFLNEATKNNNIITIEKITAGKHTGLVKWMQNEFGPKYNRTLDTFAPLYHVNYELDVTDWDKKDLEDLKKYLKSQNYIFENFLNESSEVSVEKITTPAERKALKNAFENIVTGIDKLTFKKDGTIEGKRGYFYRHGQSPEKTAMQLTSALKSQGINITVIDSYDDFKPWPKDSNFVVVFKISGVNESVNESNDEIVFSVDDDKLDQLLNSRFSRQLDYKDDKGDSFYVLDRKDFDRFIDLADSSGFDVDYENSEDSVIAVQESVVNEAASVPSNVMDFAKRKGPYAVSLVKKAAGWAEKAGKYISGGTAIGKNYSTIILDMKHQGAEIYINLDDETIELFGEEVTDPKSFKKVLAAN